MSVLYTCTTSFLLLYIIKSEPYKKIYVIIMKTGLIKYLLKVRVGRQDDGLYNGVIEISVSNHIIDSIRHPN